MGCIWVPEDITKGLERFVHAMYGHQLLSSVNEMCYYTFVQKFEK